MPHPSFEELLNYVDGSLAEEARPTVEGHLNQPCARCQQRVQHLTQLLQLMAADATVTPPAPALNRMLAVIRRLTPNRPRLPARLVFDSWQQAPLMGVRGASQAHQLLFSADKLDIDLQISPMAGALTVRGQILGGEGEGQAAPVVVLQSGPDVVASTEPDRLGQFVFKSIPAGLYDLHLEFEQNEIAIEGLRLGQ